MNRVFNYHEIAYACSLQVIDPLQRKSTFKKIYLRPDICYRLRPLLENMVKRRNPRLFLDYSKFEIPIGGKWDDTLSFFLRKQPYQLLDILMETTDGYYPNKTYYRENNPQYRQNNFIRYKQVGVAAAGTATTRNFNRQNRAQATIARNYRRRINNRRNQQNKAQATIARAYQKYRTRFRSVPYLRKDRNYPEWILKRRTDPARAGQRGRRGGGQQFYGPDQARPATFY
jgi:hypothetical protein